MSDMKLHLKKKENGEASDSYDLRKLNWVDSTLSDQFIAGYQSKVVGTGIGPFLSDDNLPVK